jgi:hypothetical protein
MGDRSGRSAFSVHRRLQRQLKSDRSVWNIHQAAASGSANGNRTATGDLVTATFADTAARGIWSAADESSGAIPAPGAECHAAATGLSRRRWVFNAQVICALSPVRAAARDSVGWEIADINEPSRRDPDEEWSAGADDWPRLR